MFSSHPAECLHKTKPSQANREESIETLEVSKPPGGENLSENYEIKTTDFRKSTKHCGLIQDEPFQKISETTTIIPNHAIKHPIDREL